MYKRQGYVLAFAFSAETGIPMFECHTRRLLLRDFIPDDWTAIFALSQAPAVTRFQSWLRLHTEAEARQWVPVSYTHLKPFFAITRAEARLLCAHSP